MARKALQISAAGPQERFKNIIEAELAERLRLHYIEITGNLSDLKCGILMLLFFFERGGSVKIYYGPKIDLFKKVQVEAEKVAESVIS